nr:hypothetical protein [Tanacetum cinerariifolium]
VEEIEDDNLREKLLNVHLLIANIETLRDNPTQSSKLLTKSSSTSLNSFLEETNTFHNSLPEFENFYFDLGEISSGSTTTHSDISLSEYDSFIFKEFVYELTHIISPPEYDHFYFEDLPDQGELMNLLDPGELMYVLNSEIRENLLSTTTVNLPIEDDYSPLLAYVLGPLGVNKVITFEVLCRSLQIEPTMTLFRVFQTLCKQGDWFSFAKRRTTSPICVDDNRSCMKHWKSGFFLIGRRDIPDAMVWRHPGAAIDDPWPVTGSFNMADVRHMSAHVIKLRDMPEGVLVLSGLSRVWKNCFCDPVLWGADRNVMGIHGFLCLHEWTGAEVQE